jgi:hypothetical protein
MRPSASLKLTAVIAAAAIAVCAVPSRRADAYYPEEHQSLTTFSLFLLYEICPEAFDRCLAMTGQDSVIREMEYDNLSYAPPKPSSTDGLIHRIAWESVSPDFFKDLVWVDVDFGPDDPHSVSIFADDDRAETSSKDDMFLGTMFALVGAPHANFTSCNHFVNIGSYGKSRFDDYDGYSYNFVKEEGHQYQTSKGMLGKALDEGINGYYGDSYVHAPGQEWYDGSSPSVERYSFPTKYPDKIAEFKDRFPMAKNVGSEGCGVPYSVFMPVDNMARYWYERFLTTGDPLDLGPLLHAVCDAGIPHHAAGYVGNWHQYYESGMKDIVNGVEASKSDRARIRELVASWDRIDDDPPAGLAPDDYRRTPAINWSIDNLTTWMALHAYRQYVGLYEPYYRTSLEGTIFPGNAREMVILGMAMNVIVLKKALMEYGTQ